MRDNLTRGLATLAAGIALGLSITGHAAAQTHLRVTLDTPPTHVRNQMMTKFVEQLAVGSGGKLTGEVFGSGQLYSSRDAGKAVARGDVEMSVTSTAALSRLEGNLNALNLPMFAGLSEAENHKVVDGPLGQKLAEMIGKKLNVVVPGKWFMLGALGSFSTKTPLTSFDSFKDMKMRIPGGAVLADRMRALGANSVAMPFPDVPLALQQGVVDGILSTSASIFSAKLTDSGIRYAFEDRAVVGYYMPIVSRKYWSQLDDAQHALFIRIWNEIADQEREAALAEQQKARAALEKIGVQYVKPSDGELAAFRAKLMAGQAALAAKLKLTPEIMALANKAAGR